MRCLSQEEIRKEKIRKYYLNKLTSKFNIEYYIKNCFDVEGLKVLLMNSNQINLFDFSLKKIVNLNNEQAVDEIGDKDLLRLQENINIEEDIFQMEENLKNNKLSKVDFKIINMLQNIMK